MWYSCQAYVTVHDYIIMCVCVCVCVREKVHSECASALVYGIFFIAVMMLCLLFGYHKEIVSAHIKIFIIIIITSSWPLQSGGQSTHPRTTLFLISKGRQALTTPQ